MRIFTNLYLLLIAFGFYLSFIQNIEYLCAENCDYKQDHLYLYRRQDVNYCLTSDPRIHELFNKWNREIALLRKNRPSSIPQRKLGETLISNDPSWLASSILEDIDLTNCELNSAPYQDYTESEEDACYGLPVTWEALAKTKSWKEKRFDHFRFCNVDFTGISFADWALNHVKVFGTSTLGPDAFSNTRLIDTYLVGPISFEQYASTWNYHYGHHDGIEILFSQDANEPVLLNNWNFYDQDISRLRLINADVSKTTFKNAIIATDVKENPLQNMTKENLYETRSYRRKDLHGVFFRCSSLADWNLREQNLSNSHLMTNDVTRLDLTDATIDGCSLSCPITKEQFYSTRSYKTGAAINVNFYFKDMTFWNLSKINLTGSRFVKTDLTGTDFTDAVITSTVFEPSKNSLTLDQIKSTWNYKTGNMDGIVLPKEIQDQLDAESVVE